MRDKTRALIVKYCFLQWQFETLQRCAETMISVLRDRRCAVDTARVIQNTHRAILAPMKAKENLIISKSRLQTKFAVYKLLPEFLFIIDCCWWAKLSSKIEQILSFSLDLSRTKFRVFKIRGGVVITSLEPCSSKSNITSFLIVANDNNRNESNLEANFLSGKTTEERAREREIGSE